MLTEEIKKTNKNIALQSFGLISSAFVLVAALAWNDLIKELINTYLNAGSGLVSRFIYAGIVTLIAAIVTIHLNKLIAKLEQPPDSKNQNP